MEGRSRHCGWPHRLSEESAWHTPLTLLRFDWATELLTIIIEPTKQLALKGDTLSIRPAFRDQHMGDSVGKASQNAEAVGADVG